MSLAFFRDFVTNNAFLVFTPKKGADDLKDFKLISLVGVVDELLAKVLANRIKKVMGTMESNVYNVFMEGRPILDVMIIANEALYSGLKRFKEGVLCKLD